MSMAMNVHVRFLGILLVALGLTVATTKASALRQMQKTINLNKKLGQIEKLIKLNRKFSATERMDLIEVVNHLKKREVPAHVLEIFETIFTKKKRDGITSAAFYGFGEDGYGKDMKVVRRSGSKDPLRKHSLDELSFYGKQISLSRTLDKKDRLDAYSRATKATFFPVSKDVYVIERQKGEYHPKKGTSVLAPRSFGLTDVQGHKKRISKTAVIFRDGKYIVNPAVLTEFQRSPAK